MKAIVDCNSFYCSCERVFRPDLDSRPVVVLSNNDGCIISRSDEAKALGVGMAAPYYQNKDIIDKNGVAVFSSNYNLYGDLSHRVMDVLRKLVGPQQVEVYSVDEAFLDLFDAPHAQLESFAIRIKETVECWTGIQVSIGIAPTKLLCKLANKLAKKDKRGTGGTMVIETADQQKKALEETMIDELWGVGRQYAMKLKNLGIETAWQLRNMPEEWARKHLGGVVGVRLIKELNGIPCIPMKDPLETKQMIATTRMFGKPVQRLSDLKEAVATYTSRAAEKLRRQHCAATLLDVFVVTNNYAGSYRYNPQTRHRAAKLLEATSNTNELFKVAMPMVESLYHAGSNYLKAGVMLGGLVPDGSIQGAIFREHEKHHVKDLMTAVDNINFSMRDNAVKYLASGLARNWKMRQDMKSRRFTTRWDELYKVK